MKAPPEMNICQVVLGAGVTLNVGGIYSRRLEVYTEK